MLFPQDVFSRDREFLLPVILNLNQCFELSFSKRYNILNL